MYSVDGQVSAVVDVAAPCVALDGAVVVVVLVPAPAAVDEVEAVVVLPGVDEVDPADVVVVVVVMITERRRLGFADRWHTNGKERVHS